MVKSYYQLKVEMASFIENELIESDASREFFHYQIAKRLGLGKKMVDAYLDQMILVGAAYEQDGKISRRKKA